MKQAIRIADYQNSRLAVAVGKYQPQPGGILPHFEDWLADYGIVCGDACCQTHARNASRFSPLAPLRIGEVGLDQPLTLRLFLAMV
jgi:hypothetical protein